MSISPRTVPFGPTQELEGIVMDVIWVTPKPTSLADVLPHNILDSAVRKYHGQRKLLEKRGRVPDHHVDAVQVEIELREELTQSTYTGCIHLGALHRVARPGAGIHNELVVMTTYTF